ncbi:MAG: hypothetical protein CL824_01145 [Crocinitomicaceae bacterium]|nr:hypothetical protein [Crocinitomicaceae bacterium]
MMKRTYILIFSLLFIGYSFGQDVQETYTSTRIINGHSVETLKARILQFRIEHRFGDFAGANGGIQNMFGFDNVADVRFAFEYGVSDKLMLGFGRSKGAGNPYRSLLDGFVKYRFLTQNKEKGIPISLALIECASLTYMKPSMDQSQVAHFPDFAHRLAYSSQINIARKFGERLSLSIMPTYTHRNYVDIDDQNGVFALGSAFAFRLSKEFSLSAEYYHAFNQDGLRANNKNSLGIAFEWITNGHNFKINFTNSQGFGETQFIPCTYSNWMDGEFRIGFSIARDFKI